MKNAARNYVVHMRRLVSRVNSREEKMTARRKEARCLSDAEGSRIFSSVMLCSSQGYNEIVKTKYLPITKFI